ncbi:hypothetical protein ABW21_db0206708 [Orbilia brochopaga]|nr:hypothetical protein ABW21_db0206708 [Drechslerella brochopaga]
MLLPAPSFSRMILACRTIPLPFALRLASSSLASAPPLPASSLLIGLRLVSFTSRANSTMAFRASILRSFSVILRGMLRTLSRVRLRCRDVFFSRKVLRCLKLSSRILTSAADSLRYSGLLAAICPSCRRYRWRFSLFTFSRVAVPTAARRPASSLDTAREMASTRPLRVYFPVGSRDSDCRTDCLLWALSLPDEGIAWTVSLGAEARQASWSSTR